MKASELAAKLMEHPNAEVYVDYIPYNTPYDEGDNFTLEFNEHHNAFILES
jgi:hypothetical protein